MRPPLTVVEQPVVLRRVTPQHHRRGSVAVFDVDGTLVFGDTLMPFLRRLAGTARLGTIVLDSLARQTGPDRRTAAKKAVLQRALGGRDLATVDRISRDYVSTTVMHRLRPDCLRRWQWHRAQGHKLVLASASVGLYLNHLGSSLGAHEVISTEMETVNGRLTGGLAGPNCRGERKADRVRDYLAAQGTGTLWVYANGRADEPLLAMADVAVRVRPCRSLAAAGEDER